MMFKRYRTCSSEAKNQDQFHDAVEFHHTQTQNNKYRGLSSHEMHNRLQSPRNNYCQKQSEIDISSDFHFIGSHETPYNENFLSENPIKRFSNIITTENK